MTKKAKQKLIEFIIEGFDFKKVYEYKRRVKPQQAFGLLESNWIKAMQNDARYLLGELLDHPDDVGFYAAFGFEAYRIVTKINNDQPLIGLRFVIENNSIFVQRRRSKKSKSETRAICLN